MFGILVVELDQESSLFRYHGVVQGVVMRMSYVLTFACGVLVCVHAATAAPPSKTDVIQCNIDAGNRPEEARRAFVEGCLTVKYTGRQANGDSTLDQPVTDKWCNTQAESKQGEAKKAFVEGCLKAKTDLKANSKASAPKK
jgi:hypothetical protein